MFIKAKQNKGQEPVIDEQSCSEDEHSNEYDGDSDIDKEERDLINSDKTGNDILGYDDSSEEYNSDEDKDSDGDNNDDDDDENDFGSNDDHNDDDHHDDDNANSDNQNRDSQKYLPPHLRMQRSSEAQQEHLSRIKRQMKGLLNRYVLLHLRGNLEACFVYQGF